MPAAPTWLRRGLLIKIMALSVTLVVASVVAGLVTSSAVVERVFEEAEISAMLQSWVTQDPQTQSETASMLAVQASENVAARAASPRATVRHC